MIPKKQNARELKDFRLISLLKSVHKIITKVLMLGFKLVMKSIIFQSQSTFIERRKILDSVLIANECIENKKLTGTKGVIYKLDLEKAYDCVN